MVDIENTELAEARRPLSTLLLPDCRIYTYIQKYDLVEIFPNVFAALRITLSMACERCKRRVQFLQTEIDTY